MHHVMKARLNDIALARAHAPDAARGRRLRAAGRLLLCLGVALAAGCSWLGQSPDPRSAADRPVFDGMDRGDIQAALAATWDRMQLSPREPYWPYHMGELYVAADSSAQAVGHLQTALVLDPTYAPAVALLSKVYYEAGSFELGATLLEEFLAGNDAAPDALRAALALHLEALGEQERAQAVLDQCTDDSGAVRTAKTFVSLRGDDPSASLDQARVALDANPKSAANHNNYGIALLYAGRPVEARGEFLSALEINDQLPGAFYNLAIVEAFYFFDNEAAQGWFTRYRQYASDDPDDLASLFAPDVSAKGETHK